MKENCILMDYNGQTFLFCYGGNQELCDKLNAAKTSDPLWKDGIKVIVGAHYYMSEQESMY